MNKIKNATVLKLESILDSIRTGLEKREETFDSRTDSWQESDKGEAHSERTNELESIADDLENLLESINEWNNEERI